MRLSFCSLTAVCLLSITLVSCSRKSANGVEVDSALKGYILPKSKVLAGVDLNNLKQTEFYRRHQSQLEIPQLNRFAEQIGIDPRRDLSSFLLSWDGTDVLAMTRGTFDPSKLEKRLSANMQQEKYNKLTLFGDGKQDVVFLPMGIALAGPAPKIKGVIADKATGSGGVSEDLQIQLARLNQGSQAWLISSGVIPLAQLSVGSNAASMLSNIADYINATAVGIKMDAGVSLDAHISCISEEGAQRVHDALRGVIGLARLSTKDNQLEQLKIWDSIHVDQQGKEVHITVELTPELADKLITALPSVTNRF